MGRLPYTIAILGILVSHNPLHAGVYCGSIISTNAYRGGVSADISEGYEILTKTSRIFIGRKKSLNYRHSWYNIYVGESAQLIGSIQVDIDSREKWAHLPIVLKGSMIDPRKGEVGFNTIDHVYRPNEGFGKEALHAVLTHFFHLRKFEKVFAVIDQEETAYLSALERLGYKKTLPNTVPFRLQAYWLGELNPDFEYLELRREDFTP
jgi:RimJ/RimL family protein N-acetyltransferase